jgi:AhpD family alkylhydroperoxidase
MEQRMTQRLNFYTAAPKALEALVALNPILEASSLEHSLMELVKIRASQINGCANCLHMHTADARKAGEREERIYLLDAWRESSMYTPRERAALAWTEALTKVAETHAPDADYEAVKAQFNEAEIAHLTVLIGAINLWNRIAIGLRAVHPNDVKLKAAA